MPTLFLPTRLPKRAAARPQDLLDNPNPDDPAQKEPYVAYKNNRAEYNRKVRELAATMRE